MGRPPPFTAAARASKSATTADAKSGLYVNFSMPARTASTSDAWAGVSQATPPGGTTASGLPMPAKLGDGKTVLLLAGDRVNIGSLGINGTVVQVLGQLGNGAQMVRIEIDKDAPKFPGMSNIYDTVSSKITPFRWPRRGR